MTCTNPVVWLCQMSKLHLNKTGSHKNRSTKLTSPFIVVCFEFPDVSRKIFSFACAAFLQLLGSKTPTLHSSGSGFFSFLFCSFFSSLVVGLLSLDLKIKLDEKFHQINKKVMPLNNNFFELVNTAYQYKIIHFRF